MFTPAPYPDCVTSYISHSTDKVPTVEQRRRLGIEGVVEVMRRGRLRWFGHVERKADGDWVSACRNFEVRAAEVGADQG